MLNPRVSLVTMGLAALIGLGSLAAGYLGGLGWLTALGWLASGISLGLFLGIDRVDGDGDAPRRSAGPATTATIESLGELELHAKVKGAFDVARLLDRLEKIHPRLARLPDDAAGLTGKLRRLFDASAQSLARAFDLHVAVRELATDAARQEVIAERERLVDESSSAIDALEKGIDRFAAAAATKGAGDDAALVGELGGDLDRQLEVARRVEQRMRELEARARGDVLSAHEQYVRE